MMSFKSVRNHKGNRSSCIKGIKHLSGGRVAMQVGQQEVMVGLQVLEQAAMAAVVAADAAVLF
jgi:hypothetical protein